jgi:hypothetical protein
MMSTPRPAMFVAMVTRLLCPASAMMDASLACSRALRTLWAMPSALSSSLSSSLRRTERVPTRTGRPCSMSTFTRQTIARSLVSSVAKTRGASRRRRIGLLVGISAQASLKTLPNSWRDSRAVPVIPASLRYRRK